MQKSIPIQEKSILQYVRDFLNPYTKKATKKTKSFTSIKDEFPQYETSTGNKLNGLKYTLILKNIGFFNLVSNQNSEAEVSLPEEVKEIRFSNSLFPQVLNQLDEQIKNLEKIIAHQFGDYKNSKEEFESYTRAELTKHELKLQSAERQKVENLAVCNDHNLNMLAYKLMSDEQKAFSGESLGRDGTERRKNLEKTLEELIAKSKTQTKEEVLKGDIEYKSVDNTFSIETPMHLSDEEQELFRKSAQSVLDSFTKNRKSINTHSLLNSIK